MSAADGRGLVQEVARYFRPHSTRGRQTGNKTTFAAPPTKNNYGSAMVVMTQTLSQPDGCRRCSAGFVRRSQHQKLQEELSETHRNPDFLSFCTQPHFLLSW